MMGAARAHHSRSNLRFDVFDQMQGRAVDRARSRAVERRDAQASVADTATEVMHDRLRIVRGQIGRVEQRLVGACWRRVEADVFVAKAKYVSEFMAEYANPIE